MNRLPHGKNALDISAILHDVDRLLMTFNSSPLADYRSFAASWRKCRLALVHFACSQKQGRCFFMQNIYNRLLDRTGSESLRIQAGAVFGLYMFYFTQPSLFRKTGIRLTATQWQSIQDIYLKAIQTDDLDLISAIHQLRQRNAFVFAAKPRLNTSQLADESANLAAFAEDTLLHLEKDTLDSNGLIPVAPLMTDLFNISTKYYYAKRDLVTLSLTRNASGAVLTHLAKQHPDQMNLRHAEPIPAFVLKEHLAEGKIIPPPTVGSVITGGAGDQENPNGLVDLLLEAQEKPQMSPEGDGEKLRNELPALPNVFPISILQASRGDYIRDIEAVLTSYVHEQYSRYKFAATGALRRNDYEFLPPRQVEKRTPQEQFAYEQLQRTKRKKLKLKIREEKRLARERAKASDKATVPAEANAAECSHGGGNTETERERTETLQSAKYGTDIDLEGPTSDGPQDNGRDGESVSQTDDAFDPYAELLRSMTLPREGNM